MSLDPELSERSQSFTELKKIFQDPNLSKNLIECLDNLEHKANTAPVKRKEHTSESSSKYQTKKRVPPKFKSKGSLSQTDSNSTQNSIQDINEELHNKLRSKRSVDKVSARFSNGGSMRRKNKHKVKQKLKNIRAKINSIAVFKPNWQCRGKRRQKYRS